MTATVVEFGEFELDCGRFELRRNGRPLRLERKPLDLLILLATSGGRLVTREEIAHLLWPSEVFVDTEHGINTAIRKIRHALRDDPDCPRFLETVTGKGYRFAGAGAVTDPAPAPGNHAVAPPSLLPELIEVCHPERAERVEGPLHIDGVPIAARPAAPRRLLWLTVITATVAIIIVAVLTVGARRVHGHTAQPSISPAAREAYLRGRYLWFSDQEPAAGEYFLKATQLAPSYAPAWADLANYYGAGMVDGDFDPRQDLSLEDASAHRAQQLDDSLPDTHLALAASDWIVDWNFPAAIHELDRAIQLDPKFSEGYHLRAKILGQLNRHDQAIADQRIAMDLNPLERPWALAFFLIRARRFDAAIAEAQQRLEGHPDPSTWSMLARAYTAKGMDKEAEHAWEQYHILLGHPSVADAMHRAFVRGGTNEVLRERLSYLTLQSQKHYVSPVDFATTYARLGDKQRALDALDEAVRQHSPMVFDIQNETAFDSLHSDPRYRAIVQRIGLPPAW